MSRHGRSSNANKEQVKANKPEPQLPATTDNAKGELKPGEDGENVKKGLWTTLKDGYQKISDGCKAFDVAHPKISKVLKITTKVVAIGGAVFAGYTLAKGSDDSDEVYDLDEDGYEEFDDVPSDDDPDDTPLAEEAAEE